MSNTKLGGWSELKLFTSEQKKMCFEARPIIEKKLGTHFKIYNPVVYHSQVVSGMNYMVKMLVDADGDGVCVHAKIYKAIPCDSELIVTEIQHPKSFDDPLILPEHFSDNRLV